MVGHWLVAGHAGDKLVYDTFMVAVVMSIAITHGRWRWLNVFARWVIAIAFLGSVADRFGLLGAPGDPGVSWGSFNAFVDYTRQVNAFLPAGLAPTLAVLATMAETGLGLALLIGFWPRSALRASAALLVVFGLAMAVSLGVAAQFDYAVLVIAVGASYLSTVDATALSVSAGWTWRHRRAATAASRA